jgi:hypothetical protein
VSRAQELLSGWAGPVAVFLMFQAVVLLGFSMIREITR